MGMVLWTVGPEWVKIKCFETIFFQKQPQYLMTFEANLKT